MKNPLWFYTREEVEFFGKPFFTGHRWIGNFNDKDNRKILLTRSRCNHLGYPVGDTEEAAGYRYTINGTGDRKYVPVYDRTASRIPVDALYPKEVYEEVDNE